MKRFYKNFIKINLLFGSLLLSGLSFGAFSGTYTIDATAAASSTNYKTFTALFGDMYNGSRNDGGTSNGAGVSGPVVINVVTGSGPYTEQVVLYQYSGISSTNNIKINGNGNTLQFSATSTSSAHTLQLNGADYITVDNLVIIANSSSIGRCVHMINDAQYNTISNCKLQMPQMTSTSSNNAYICITQGTSSMQTYGDAGRENTITGCTTSALANGGPYSGIAIMDASSGSTVKKNYITNNKIQHFRNYGIWTYYCFQQTITGNEIFNTSTTNIAATTYGMYNYCYNKGGDFIIEDNYIHDLNGYATSFQYGIYHYMYYGTGSADVRIQRNKIVLNNLRYYAYGLYAYGYYSSISGKFMVNNNYVELEQQSGNTSYLYGMYCLGAYYYTAFKAANIDYNYVSVKTPYYAYGILGYIYYNNQLTQNGSISGNIVNAQTNYTLQAGVYAYCGSNNQKVDVCYNTVYSSNYAGGTINATKYHIYMYYVDGKVNNNNLVSFDNGGTTFGIYEYYSTATFSNNNVYDAGRGTTYSHGARTGSPTSSFANFKTSFADNNALSVDPKFRDIAKGNFKPSSFAFVNKGVPVSGMTTDYAGVTRNTNNPDIGALEFYVDVNISKLYFTGVNVCGGYKEAVKITAINNTTDTLKSVPVKFTITGKSPVLGSIPLILPNDSAQYTFSTLAEFNGSGSNTIDVELDGTDDEVSNNKQSRSLNITPSPAGFKLAESSTFPGYFRPGNGGGIKTNPDATVPGRKVVYDIEPSTSTGYSNSNYGTLWTLSTKYYTEYNNPVSGPVYTAPSGTSNGTISFDPSSSLTDSLIYLEMSVKNLNTGCDSIFGRWIYIPHIPVPAFTGTDVCEGNVAVFNNKTTLGEGTPQYKWKFNDKGTPEDSSFLIDPVFNFSTYGVYDVVLTAWSAQFPKFTTTYSKFITVTPIPVISFKVVNACEKTPVKFTNSSSLPIPGTITYNWDFGDPSTTLDKSTNKEPSWTYANPGGYKVTLRATANGCTGELTKNANQFATPKANWSAPANICDKSDVQFTNLSTIQMGNMGYTWSFGDGGVSNFAAPTHKYTSAGNKTIKMKAVSEFGCTDSMTKVVTLAESPNADFTWGAACNLSSTNFTFTGSKPGAPVLTTFNWNFSGEGTTTLENPSKLFSVVGKKSVTLTLVSNNGCSNTITKDVFVKLQSKADFVSEDVCENDDAVFTNKSTVSAGNLVYSWKFGDGAKSTAASPRHRYNIGGVSKTYNVTLTAIVPGGCSDSITKAVSVNAAPDAGFTYTKSGRMVYFNAKTAGATVYQWRFGDGGSATTSNPQYHYLAFPSGNYTACLAVVNAAGCFSETCQSIAITGGVDKIAKLSGVKVYPNPNKGNFTVTVEDPKSDISVAVYNLLGDAVKVIETSPLKSTYTVDLNVANGVYLVKVTNGGLTSTQKVTVNK